jgi:hypothetical protein
VTVERDCVIVFVVVWVGPVSKIVVRDPGTTIVSVDVITKGSPVVIIATVWVSNTVV